MRWTRGLLRNPQLFFRISPPSTHNSKVSNIRHVKFKRPWIRRFFTTCLLYGLAFQVWSSSVLVQFDDALDDTDTSQKLDKGGKDANQGSDGEKRRRTRRTEGPENEDPTFIPLGWPRLREAEFYAASDPEWQQFLKISQDRKRLQSLRDELATRVLNSASQSSLLSHMLGGPLTMTGFWLIHHFPSRAPPRYSRLELEIGDNHIGLVSRGMSSEDGDKLRGFMRPIFVTLAVRDAFYVFIGRKFSRFRNSNLYQENMDSDTISRPSEKTFSTDLQGADGLGHVSQPEPQLPLSNSSRDDMSRTNEDSRLHPSSIISSLQRLPLPSLGPGSDLYVASLAFKWRLNHCWARKSHSPRRGAFYVSGPVGLKGPKGSCRVEVKGEYDPATSSWTNVSMQLKDLKVSRQRALGGRK